MQLLSQNKAKQDKNGFVESATQTDIIHEINLTNHQCPVREIEKIIEVPIEIPVANPPLSPRPIKKPTPIELQVMRVIPRLEPFDRILDRLIESLNEELSNIEQHLTNLLMRIVALPEMKDSLQRVLAHQRSMWIDLKLHVDRAIEMNELEISRNLTERQPSIIQTTIPIFQKGDISAFRPPLTQSIFMEDFAMQQLSYPLTVEQPRSINNVEIHEVTNIMPVEVPVQKFVRKTMILESAFEVHIDRFIDKIVEVPLEVERLIEVERIIEREKFVEVDRLVQVPLEIIKQVPVQVIVQKEIPIELIKEIPVEVIRQVCIDRLIEIPLEIPVEMIKEVYIDRTHLLEQPVEVDKLVEVERIVEVEKRVDVPLEKIVYIDKIIEKIVEVEKIMRVEAPVEKIVEVEKIIETEVPIVKQHHDNSADKGTHHQSGDMPLSGGPSPNRLDESSIEQAKSARAFSELQHIEETLQRHQEDLNKRYEEFQSQSRQQNEVLRNSMMLLQEQIDRLTEELTEHRKYSMKLEQQNAIIKSRLESKEIHKHLSDRLDQLEEMSKYYEDQNESLKLENERLQTRLEELVEELEQARSQTNELMEQVNSRNVEEVQHEIEDIKQWEKLVDELTAEKESLKGLIQEAIQKAKSLQQRNSLFEAQIEQYKSIVKLSDDETKSLTAKVHQLSLNQTEQEAVIERLRADKANLKNSLEEVCADNQKLKTENGIDQNMYERVLNENEFQKGCLADYRCEIEQLMDTVESYKQLLLRGDEIVGALYDERRDLSSQADDICYRETMVKLKSRQTAVVEQGKSLNRLIHEENKRLLKEVFDMHETNYALKRKLNVLESENELLNKKMHYPSSSQDFVIYTTSRQGDPKFSTMGSGDSGRRTMEDIKENRNKERLIEELKEQLQQQKIINLKLRKDIQYLTQDLLSYERELSQKDSEQAPLNSHSSMQRDPDRFRFEQVGFSSYNRIQTTQKRFNNSCRDTRVVDCCQLAEQLFSRLYDLNPSDSAAELRSHLNRFINVEAPKDYSMKRQSTMDMSTGGLSRFDFSLKHLRGRTEILHNCIEEQTERSEHTKYMARIRSQMQLPSKSESSFVRSSDNIPSSGQLYPSTHELTFENFVKVFTNTSEWIYYVMLRLTEAVDIRLAETGNVTSLHPREIAVYNWEQQDPSAIVIRIKDEQPFDKPIHLYLAPEILAGQTETEHSLAWNLGIIFDYLVHGDLYFKSKAEILDEHSNNKINVDSFRFRDEEQPSQVKRLIEKLIQRSKQQRLSICQLIVNIRFQVKKLPVTF